MSAKESKAPAFIKLSKDFLFAARKSIRFAKSKIELKFPFSSLSLIIALTAPAPTPFTAAIPKRTAPSSFTENFK